MKTIEFAHLSSYSETEIQINLKILSQQTQPYQALILLDDYHQKNWPLDLETMIKLLRPTAIISEAALVETAHQILQTFPKELLRTHGHRLSCLTPSGPILLRRRDGKYSCVFLTACWYLIRLGRQPLPSSALLYGHFTVGGDVINILPHIYQKNELAVTQFLELLEPNLPIHHIFYYHESV